MTAGKVDIQIPNIEKDLKQALDDAIGVDNQKNKISKACLFTLVIYGNEERRIKYLQELIESILDKFPCRIIFIKADKNASDSYFHVTVSNVISGQSSASGGASVACDQIVINTSYDQNFRVPYVVIPHIVSDRPVYLLWGENPFEEQVIFPQLQPFITRVIFDSEFADNLTNFCKEMEASLNTLKMEVMDISWALVSNWRDLLIQLFDSPEKISQLDLIKSVIIKYNAIKTETMHHPEIRPLYLQGWLASCLNWNYLRTEMFDDCPIISYIGKNHPAIVGLVPLVLPEMTPGAINEIEINISNGISYFIARKPGLSQVVVHVSSKESCELPFTLPLPNVHRGLTFMREIFFNPLGDRYLAMLKIISQIDTSNFNEK